MREAFDHRENKKTACLWTTATLGSCPCWKVEGLHLVEKLDARPLWKPEVLQVILHAKTGIETGAGAKRTKAQLRGGGKEHQGEQLAKNAICVRGKKKYE